MRAGRQRGQGLRRAAGAQRGQGQAQAGEPGLTQREIARRGQVRGGLAAGRLAEDGVVEMAVGQGAEQRTPGAIGFRGASVAALPAGGVAEPVGRDRGGRHPVQPGDEDDQPQAAVRRGVLDDQGEALEEGARRGGVARHLLPLREQPVRRVQGQGGDADRSMHTNVRRQALVV
jgi:hypothetical protein